MHQHFVLGSFHASHKYCAPSPSCSKSVRQIFLPRAVFTKRIKINLTSFLAQNQGHDQNGIHKEVKIILGPRSGSNFKKTQLNFKIHFVDTSLSQFSADQFFLTHLRLIFALIDLLCRYGPWTPSFLYCCNSLYGQLGFKHGSGSYIVTRMTTLMAIPCDWTLNGRLKILRDIDKWPISKVRPLKFKM